MRAKITRKQSKPDKPAFIRPQTCRYCLLQVIITKFCGLVTGHEDRDIGGETPKMARQHHQFLSVI